MAAVSKTGATAVSPTSHWLVGTKAEGF